MSLVHNTKFHVMEEMVFEAMLKKVRNMEYIQLSDGKVLCVVMYNLQAEIFMQQNMPF